MSKRLNKDKQCKEPELRRVKLVRVSQLDIMRYLWGQDELPAVVCLPRYPLPEGFRILAANYNWERNTIDFLIHHSSFEPVPDGEIPPIFVNPEDENAVYLIPTWTMHCLATEEEVHARSIKEQSEMDKAATELNETDRV